MTKFNLNERGIVGDCVCGDEHDEDACKWFKDKDIELAVDILKAEIDNIINYFDEINWRPAIFNRIDEVFEIKKRSSLKEMKDE